mgnify:FL=1
MSRASLVRKIHISVTALQKIEEDRTKNPKDIERIAAALAVDPAWLRFGSNGASTVVLNKEETALISRYRQLNQDEKNFIVKCIAGLLNETYK